MPFYERGDVRIRYEEAGSGFPLLVTPGGGLNSRLNYWPNSVINAFEAFKSDFRCITMDQRNANEGKSTGPLAIDDPWGGFAEDQLGLMDHLGIDKFAYMGFCIGMETIVPAPNGDHGFHIHHSVFKRGCCRVNANTNAHVEHHAVVIEGEVIPQDRGGFSFCAHFNAHPGIT